MAEKVFLTVQSDYHKVSVPVDDIMYITIEGRKTKITRAGGSVVYTNRSLKDIYEELSEEVFSSINRGIVVSRNYIKGDQKGVVTMTDGTAFRRRVRSDRMPQREKQRLQAAVQAHKPCPAETLDQWLGTLDLPVCILELVYRSRGQGGEFLIRYCNGAMADLEGVKLPEARDKSVGLFPDVATAKWLKIFADVAINGSHQVQEEMFGDRWLRVHCYQPQHGFCALVLADLTKENKLVQELFRRGK